MKLSIVIPCYNEENSLRTLFDNFDRYIGERLIEVIFVNNGSTDESQKIFDDLIIKYKFAKLVKIEINQGYGYGIIQGLKAASGDYLGWTHADLQTDPRDIIRAYDYIKRTNKKNIYVKGKRKGRPLFDVFFTCGMSIFESILFGIKLHDINAQPNIFPYDFFDKWINPPKDFSLDLFSYYFAKKNNIEIIRFPVNFSTRKYGKSKWNTSFFNKLKFIKRTILYSLYLKKTNYYRK